MTRTILSGDVVWVRHRAYWRRAKVIRLYERGARFCRVQFLKVVDARDNGRRWPEARDVCFPQIPGPGGRRVQDGTRTYPEIRLDTPPRDEMGAEWKFEAEAFELSEQELRAIVESWVIHVPADGDAR